MRKFIFLILVATVFMIFGRTSQAQEASLIYITWRADTLAPADFVGKRLPTSNSYVTASVEVLAGSRLTDLGQQNIFWYTNDDLVASGTGRQKISFRMPAMAGTVVDLRVELPDYPGGSLSKTVEVFTVRPEAVILTGLTNNYFSAQEITLRALAYFFNGLMKNLSFNWSVNGLSPENAENPQELLIKLDPGVKSGTTLNTNLSVRGRGGESAIKNLKLKFVP